MIKLFNENSKRIIVWRRQERDLKKEGYRCHETDWEILRGGRRDEVIVDVKISICGKYVYTKIGPKPLADQIGKGEG